MKKQHAKKEISFDWVFLNCVKVIYVCDFRNDKMEPIILPQNAENFLNNEAEYLRNLHEWRDGEVLDEVPEEEVIE